MSGSKPTDVSRRLVLGGGSALAMGGLLRAGPAWAQTIAPQPFFASAGRAVEALAAGGQPVAPADAEAVETLRRQGDAAAVAAAEVVLDRYTLARVDIGASGYPQASAGGAPKLLIEQGWSLFLVRVSNQPGLPAAIEVATGAVSPILRSTNAQRPHGQRSLNRAPALANAWILPQMHDTPPVLARLSGAPVEYLIVQIYARDRGRKRAYLKFGAGGDPTVQRLDLAAYGVDIEFESRPSHEVALAIRDHDGRGCMASLTISDALGRIYPLQAMRIAPDLTFQRHIYRADGETVRLPDGDYLVESWRGPEYVRGRTRLTVAGGDARLAVQLRRWIDPTEWGWYSGDTHIHAAGCAHYSSPAEGIAPATVIRHVRGEGLALGNVLTWGPGWYYQKQFFSGHAVSPEAALEHPELQAANETSLMPRPTPKDDESLIRYDVEVSGFPSSHSGHVILLRLAQQDYPGTSTIEEWPSWNLPILRWGRSQGAIVGYAHCGDRMAVGTDELPNYRIPPMDGVGANEAMVDVTHGAVDFLSCCEWMPSVELNTWYHILNCGLRVAMVGETDFPCLSGDRPGFGRSYVLLPERPRDDAGYNAWVEAMKAGHLYFGDGRSHFLGFTVDGRERGGEDVRLARPGKVSVAATVAAWLEPEPTPETEKIRTTPPFAFPQWHLERARIGAGRRVPVELIVNGVAVERAELLADGKPRRLRFRTRIERSSWIALRVLASGHTHPIFVGVAGRPVRASRRSAEWLLACVDRLWEMKSPLIRDGERAAAAEAYEHARRTYRAIAAESAS